MANKVEEILQELTEEDEVEVSSLVNKYVETKDPKEREKIYIKLKDNQLYRFMEQLLKSTNLKEAEKKILKPIFDSLKIQKDIAQFNLNHGKLPETNSRENSISIEKLFQIGKSIKQFKGTANEDIQSWLFYINATMDLAKLDDNMRIKFVMNYLDGAPSNHYIRYVNDCKKNFKAASWIEFENILKNIYKSPSKELDVRKQLRNLKQRNFRSIYEYNDEFTKLISSIDDLPEIDLIDKYLSGLEENLASKIELERVDTLNEAIHQAIIYSGYSLNKNQSVLAIKRMYSNNNRQQQRGPNLRSINYPKQFNRNN